jgi:hypothetical protein
MRRQWRGDTQVVDDAPQASLVQERAPAKSDQAPRREMREQTMLEELIRDMRELKIANAQLSTKENQSGYNRRQSGLRRCIWCDDPNHFRSNCEDLQEAL